MSKMVILQAYRFSRWRRALILPQFGSQHKAELWSGSCERTHDRSWRFSEVAPASRTVRLRCEIGLRR